MQRTLCQVCKEVLFVGPADPMDQYLAGLGGWGGVPLAVCLGSWRSLWRRKWYHQTCCGVHWDRTNRAGRWHIFGGFGDPRDALKEYHKTVVRIHQKILASSSGEAPNLIRWIDDECQGLLRGPFRDRLDYP
jgi:hypothetical protein